MKKGMLKALSLFMFLCAAGFFAAPAAWAWGSSSYGTSSDSSTGSSSSSGSSYGGSITEQECRVCHGDLNRFPQLKFSNTDKHHVLVSQKIPATTVAPYGTPDTDYACLSCHSMYQVDNTFNVTVERNCLECHPLRTVTGSPRSDNVHHQVPTYRQFRCSVCHSNWR